MRQSSGLRWVAGCKTPEKVYITRVFNFGTWEEWRRMKKRCAKNQIRRAIRHPLRGEWTKRAKRFAELLFDLQMPEETLISYDA